MTSYDASILLWETTDSSARYPLPSRWSRQRPPPSRAPSAYKHRQEKQTMDHGRLDHFFGIEHAYGETGGEGRERCYTGSYLDYGVCFCLQPFEQRAQSTRPSFFPFGRLGPDETHLAPSYFRWIGTFEESFYNLLVHTLLVCLFPVLFSVPSSWAASASQCVRACARVCWTDAMRSFS